MQGIHTARLRSASASHTSEQDKSVVSNSRFRSHIETTPLRSDGMEVLRTQGAEQICCVTLMLQDNLNRSEDTRLKVTTYCNEAVSVISPSRCHAVVTQHCSTGCRHGCRRQTCNGQHGHRQQHHTRDAANTSRNFQRLHETEATMQAEGTAAWKAEGRAQKGG